MDFELKLPTINDLDRLVKYGNNINKASHRILEKADFRLAARLEKAILKNNVCLDKLIYVNFKTNQL